ncbi:MAG: dTDP-glucose 4,6-dehydratase [Candidatus Jacksonbacteria bacterium]|nr:dTDP-glucose 4,6-dehydratase [Candidatus Jacksonbacteria bacterium]
MGNKHTVLVSGGAGFMGSHFVRYLLKHYPHYRVVNVDKLSYAGNLANLTDIKEESRHYFILGNIADEAIVRNIFKMERPDFVVNYAAETLVDRSIAGPKIFVESNIVGTQNLLEAVREFDHVKKFVQISTDEVYGEILEGSATEESVCRPRNPYAATKAGADHLVTSYINTYKVPAVITRSCNFYGPNQYPEKVIPIFITNLLAGKKIFIHGDGGQTREWIFTDDHCRAVDTVLHKGEIGEIYNISSGESRSVFEIANDICLYMERDSNEIEFTRDRPGNDRRYALDWEKLRNLGWEPIHKFCDGLAHTVEWYRNNQTWWESIKATPEFQEYYEHKYLTVQ